MVPQLGTVRTLLMAPLSGRHMRRWLVPSYSYFLNASSLQKQDLSAHKSAEATRPRFSSGFGPGEWQVKNLASFWNICYLLLWFDSIYKPAVRLLERKEGRKNNSALESKMEIIKPPGASSSPVAFRPMRCFDSEVVSLPLGTSRCWPVWLRKGRRWTIWRRLARNSDQAYLGVVNIYKIQKNEWNREIDDQFCTKPAESFKLGAH